jgi:hypothetical protein
MINDIFNKTFLYHTAPTLSNLKPANLINFSTFNRLNQLGCCISREKINQLLAHLQIKIVIQYKIIHYQPGKQTLILFYNEEMLQKILYKPENQTFLACCGYETSPNVKGYLNQLSLKTLSRKFPHEIGIFLGIPLGDVLGFIVNKGKNYIFNQYWKVYQNPFSAKKIFASYDCAKIDLLQRLKKYL